MRMKAFASRKAAAGTVHVHLRFGTRPDGTPRMEAVHAAPLGGARYRIANSPGWTYGVAAGDEVERTDEGGGFKVIRRSGNIAVRLFSTSALKRDDLEALEARVEARLGGRVDGGLDDRALVFTIPPSAALQDIAALFDPFVRTASIDGGDVEWEYGNVLVDADAPSGATDTASVARRDR